RQDGAEPVLAERPDRVLARRATSEVLPGEEQARTLRGRSVQLEVRIGRAVGPKAPVVEQRRPEPRALHPFQELLWNDLIGVDVGARQRRELAGEPHKGLDHAAPPPPPPPPPPPAAPHTPAHPAPPPPRRPPARRGPPPPPP